VISLVPERVCLSGRPGGRAWVDAPASCPPGSWSWAMPRRVFLFSLRREPVGAANPARLVTQRLARTGMSAGEPADRSAVQLAARSNVGEPRATPSSLLTIMSESYSAHCDSGSSGAQESAARRSPSLVLSSERYCASLAHATAEAMVGNKWSEPGEWMRPARWAMTNVGV
jgi:hypothetical protein